MTFKSQWQAPVRLPPITRCRSLSQSLGFVDLALLICRMQIRTPCFHETCYQLVWITNGAQQLTVVHTLRAFTMECTLLPPPLSEMALGREREKVGFLGPALEIWVPG